MIEKADGYEIWIQPQHLQPREQEVHSGGDAVLVSDVQLL
jgi:hypothetical protein